MEEWVAVELAELSPGETCAVEVQGRRLLVGNAEGALFALENRCPHGLIPLTTGRLRGTVLECPLHGGKLDVRDGRPCAPPIRTRVATFAVRSAANGIEIRLAP